jgi:hypothetical protein
MIVSQTQRFMAERMHAAINPRQVDHTPSVSAPGLVSELILDVVKVVKG